VQEFELMAQSPRNWFRRAERDAGRGGDGRITVEREVSIGFSHSETIKLLKFWLGRQDSNLGMAESKSVAAMLRAVPDAAQTVNVSLCPRGGAVNGRTARQLPGHSFQRTEREQTCANSTKKY
jgi:hypothetical protein